MHLTLDRICFKPFFRPLSPKSKDRLEGECIFMVRRSNDIKLSRFLLLISALLSCVSVLAQPVIDDFFDGTVDQTFVRTLTPGNEDKTDELTGLIDEVAANPNGGVVKIPDGTYTFGLVSVKSNVHISISKGAILKPLSTKGMFSLAGEDNNSPIENVKIFCEDCTGDEKFTFDLTEMTPDAHGKAFVVMKAKNFWLSDFEVIDNRTTMSAVTLNPYLVDKDIPSTPVVDREVLDSPIKGVVKNATLKNGHMGYGLVQVQIARDIWFEDLHGIRSGVTLRLESGAGVALVPTPTSIQIGQTTGIIARNISSEGGAGCMTLSPHGRINGSVDIKGLTTRNSIFAIKLSNGFFDRAIQDANGNSIDPTLYKKGWFDGPIKLSKVSIAIDNVATVEEVISWHTKIQPVCGVWYSTVDRDMVNDPPDQLHADGHYTMKFNENISVYGYSQCLADRDFIIFADEKKDCIDDWAGDVTSLKKDVVKGFVHQDYPKGSEVSLYNIAGRKILTYVTTGKDVPLYNVKLTPGIYYVIIRFGGRELAKSRLVALKPHIKMGALFNNIVE